MACCHFNRHSSLLLFFRLVHDVCEREASLVVDFSLALVLVNHVLRDLAVLEQNLT